MTAEILSTSQGQTMVLTLSNPLAHNALEPPMYAAGVEAFNAAECSKEVRSIVIVGAGLHFSAGDTAHQLHAARQLSAEVQAQHLEGLHSWIEAIRTCPKPVIAAVEGTAMEAGFALALACDFIVAARNAQFIMDCSRFALSPAAGSSWTLSRSLPRQAAAEMLLLGQAIDAQRLHGLGVVNLLCEPQTALSEALLLAERLNARAPNALASTKELLNDAANATLTEHLAAEREHHVRNLQHTNAVRAVEALLARSLPRFE
jgi:enoyl-CoA hydratase/carnithine racemase